ncbi:PIN domain-containing protein [Desulfofundulus thermobenzoicus]|uniref:PIN domain-containing protein n=1 Tax=Desulfofundulus thermobenzoicus TaxID=29376 RepID=A0A6N7INJ5_9FIRM|nr:PIN domain-containing protein [Desulfofundulus thermobenzoicus]
MGITEFLATVKKHQRVLIDTNIAIYFLENNPVFGQGAGELFQMVEAGKIRAYLSVISVTELLVKPLRAGNEELVEKIMLFINYFPNLEVIDLTRDIAVRAAEVRAATNLKVPDAILVATAATTDCALIGNDRECAKKNLAVPYIYLEEFLTSPAVPPPGAGFPAPT